MTTGPVSGWPLDEVAGLTAAGSASATFADLSDTFERANGPLTMTQAPSGHWYNASGSLPATIISGRMQQASVGNSYMFTDLGAVPSRIGGYWSANGANGDGTVVIGLSPEYSQLTGHLIHVYMTRTVWAIQTTQTGAGAGMVTLLTGAQALVNDGTPYKFFIRVSGQTITIELPDGTEQSVISSAIATNGGRYAFFQNSYTSGAAPAWDSIAATSACVSTNSPGIYNGTPVYGSSGPLTHSAITFSGDDNITLPGSTPWPGSGSYSVAAWAYFDAIGTAQTVYAIGDLFNTGSDPFLGRSVKLAIAADGKPFVTFGEGNNSATQSHNTAISAAAWHLLVGVLDRTAATVRIYVDGVASSNAAGSSAAVGAITAYNSAQRTIGNRTFGGPGEYLVGRAALVNVFDRAITTAEMAGLLVGTVPSSHLTSTVRVDLRAALVASLQGYGAANATQLKRTFPTRPASAVTDLPFAYVDLGAEGGSFDNGVRDRTYAPGFVVVDYLSDNAEAVARMDLTIDELVETLTALVHPVTGSSWSNYTVTEVDVAEGTYAVRIAIADFSKLEGRT